MGSVSRTSRRWIWVAAGLTIGLAGGWWVAGPERAAELTAEDLEAARDRWRTEGPASYLAVIETRGPTGATHRVRVEEGEVVEMTTDGRPATRSAWSYWTVDGLFDFLQAEMRNAADPPAVYGVPAGNVVLRAGFDDELGYPRHFLRHVLGGGASVEWRVLELDAVP